MDADDRDAVASCPHDQPRRQLLGVALGGLFAAHGVREAMAKKKEKKKRKKVCPACTCPPPVTCPTLDTCPERTCCECTGVTAGCVIVPGAGNPCDEACAPGGSNDSLYAPGVTTTAACTASGGCIAVSCPL